MELSRRKHIFVQLVSSVTCWNLIKTFIDGEIFHAWENGDYVAANNHFHLLLQREGDLSFSQNAIDFGVMNGNFQLIEWIHNVAGSGCTRRALDIASENGHIAVLKWLYNNVSQDISETAMNMAAWNGHSEVVEWIFQTYSRNNGAFDLVLAMEFAIEGGNLSVAEWLHSRLNEKYVPDCEKIDYAAWGGHLRMIEWLSDKLQAQFSDLAIHNAASGGHLETLEWLYRNMDSNTQKNWSLHGENIALERAADEGHLHVIEWLTQNIGAKCTVSAMDKSIQHGHLNIVEWFTLQSPSIGFTYGAIQSALIGNKNEVVHWLQLNRPDDFPSEIEEVGVKVKGESVMKSYNVM